MFTGIIEDLGILKKIEKEEGNINLYFKSKLTQELKIDQSLSHNGVCLTVVSKFLSKTGKLIFQGDSYKRNT